MLKPITKAKWTCSRSLTLRRVQVFHTKLVWNTSTSRCINNMKQPHFARVIGCNITKQQRTYSECPNLMLLTTLWIMSTTFMPWSWLSHIELGSMCEIYDTDALTMTCHYTLLVHTVLWHWLTYQQYHGKHYQPANMEQHQHVHDMMPISALGAVCPVYTNKLIMSTSIITHSRLNRHTNTKGTHAMWWHLLYFQLFHIHTYIQLAGWIEFEYMSSYKTSTVEFIQQNNIQGVISSNDCNDTSIHHARN